MATDTFSPSALSLPIKIPRPDIQSTDHETIARAQECMYKSPKTYDVSQNPIAQPTGRRRMSTLYVDPRLKESTAEFHADPRARRFTPPEYQRGPAHHIRKITSAYGSAQSPRRKRVIRPNFKADHTVGSDDSDGCSSSSGEDGPTTTVESMSSEKVFSPGSPKQLRRQSLLTEMFQNDRATKTIGSAGTSISSDRPPSLVWSRARGTTPPSSVGGSEAGSATPRSAGKGYTTIGPGERSYGHLDGGQPW